MPGTRTAPTVGGSPNKVVITISVVDASGDIYADSLVLDAVPLDADIEAYVAGYQSVTQASLYSVNVQQIYVGDKDADNALTAQRNSVTDGINLLWRDDINLKSQSTRVVAPITDVMQGNQDIPLLSYANMITYIAEAGDLLTDYAIQSAQYTNRRQRNNERISA